MASPFPGMDPYLESHWGDIHHGLITYARDQLQIKLPPGVRARVEERVFVESGNGADRSIYPDVHVVEHYRETGTSVAAETGLAVAEPLVIHIPDEPVTQGFIEIIDVSSGNRVITVIEVLSPSNKLPGPGQDLYLRKQQDLMQGEVSLVEVNLLRAGQWIVAVPWGRIPL